MPSNEEESRPAMFLYLVSRLVVVMLPLTAFILGALNHFGIKIDIFTTTMAIIMAFYASKWYEQLSYEVQIYIEKKYK